MQGGAAHGACADLPGLVREWLAGEEALGSPIYFWQQFFFAPPYAGLLHLAVAVCWAVLAAQGSYYVVERPFLRLRQTLERREPKELAGAGPELSLE